MKLYIKYMVTRRCKLIVQTTLEQLGLAYSVVNLGEVELNKAITAEQRDQLKIALLISGLELMDDKKAILIEKIKALILEMVENTESPLKLKNSEYISKKLDYDYTYLSNQFSQVSGTTIEQYVILQRIEKVKELLLYDELSLSQIADKMQYSSVAHLSHQFKKVTGLTTTLFKELKDQYRKAEHNELLLFDQFIASFGWSISEQQKHYYHRSITRGCILMLTNLKKTILWTSRSFLNLTGYKPIDILGKTPAFLQGPDTDPITLRFIREQLNVAQTVEAELVNYRSDGEHYLCHLLIEPLCNEQGEATHYLAVEYDVNDEHECVPDTVPTPVTGVDPGKYSGSTSRSAGSGPRGGLAAGKGPNPEAGGRRGGQPRIHRLGDHGHRPVRGARVDHRAGQRARALEARHKLGFGAFGRLKCHIGRILGEAVIRTTLSGFASGNLIHYLRKY